MSTSYDISDLLAPEAILPAVKVSSKRQLLQTIAAKAGSLTGLSEREIFDTLLQRERLGSTGTGNGFAIPHGKMADLDRLIGVFARLEHPIDYEAPDDQPVDIVFALLAPESAGADHLKALARVARQLRDNERMRTIRGMHDAEAIYARLNQVTPESNAA